MNERPDSHDVEAGVGLSRTRRLQVAGGPEAPHPRLVFDAIKALHSVVYYIVTLTSPPATRGCANVIRSNCRHSSTSRLMIETIGEISVVFLLNDGDTLNVEIVQLTAMRLVPKRHSHSMEVAPEKVRPSRSGVESTL